MTPEDILPTYDTIAEGFARGRNRTLFERRWLDRMLDHAPGRRLLDLGCGPGVPIATYLDERRAEVTGVDGAPAMISLFRKNLPRATAIHCDMRALDLGARFDAILAWNSFFHLPAADQRAMFRVFGAHSAPRAVLMFTSGTCAGEAIGEVGGRNVYHASLSPDEYRALLRENGFSPLAFVPEDPQCNGHSVWLARYTGQAEEKSPPRHA